MAGFILATGTGKAGRTNDTGETRQDAMERTGQDCTHFHFFILSNFTGFGGWDGAYTNKGRFHFTSRRMGYYSILGKEEGGGGGGGGGEVIRLVYSSGVWRKR